ncbi:SusD/RagB family nutrient-binding outer membrane lipoprotein [Flectobacillus major]|uniref:SusD/RagB family nutrient-binding outer membrane lipoprotein n=1 Tax=Flectobacillus major TaxID=103 RepID=UPI00047AC50C|nr:SusD/RagB family nutrient-binding outer membrane lipoprotein [Flectobacillus major]
MIRKNILKSLGLASVMLFAASCSDFGTMNDNPNAIVTPVTSALLTNALLDFDSPATTGSMRNGLYCQYFAETQYTETSLYAIPQIGWDGLYAGSLYDLQNIINNNTDAATKVYAALNGSNNNQIALARIVKAYRLLMMTDQWGDMPYSEALKLNNIPKYDSQQDIYTGLFKELKEAVAQFDGGAVPAGDIVHSGNITRWKKFANSLRLVMALRLSKVDATTGKAQFLDALASNGGVIESNDDNTQVVYPGGTYKSPWFNLYNGRKDYGVSDVLVNMLNSTSDARVLAFGEANASGTVVPMPYGLTRDDAVNYTNAHADWSRILNPNFRLETSTTYVLTASHVFLARAEAAALGWTTESAATMYSKGIEASWKQWGVFDQTKFNTFLTSEAVQLGSTDALTKIRTQRYIAFFPDGANGWSEWRRTGVPNLTPSSKATNASKQIPRRFVYGSNEPNLNKANYQAAVSRLTGGDTQDAKIWWDK